MEINGKTKITGLFGYPVKHTLSPAMHNAAFMRLGLDYVYVPFEVSPKNLKSALYSLKALGISGINVTIPHKENVIPFLDKFGPLVKQVGSVNTIVNSDGKLIGYNTDAPGFLKDLRSQGFSPKGKTVILFGAGGAGKAVAAALASAGVKKIYITDFAEQKAHAIAKKTSSGTFLSFNSWKSKIKESSLLVNATPVGMHPGKPFVASKELTKGIFVYDLVYNRRTELGLECKKAGVKYSNGLGMLLYQGALAFEYFTGKKAPVEVMRKALNKQLGTK